MSDPTPTHVLPPDRDPAETPRQRFVDRVWSFQAMLVVALVSVVLGGLAGAGLASVGDHQDRRVVPGHVRRGGLGPMAPGGEQWQWRDGAHSDQMPRGMGPRQWSQQGPSGPPGAPVTPLRPSPTPGS